MSLRKHFSSRSLVLLAIPLAVLWATRQFVVQGWLLPVRVVSNSMAPALIGPHQLLTCDRCGWQFASAACRPPAAESCYCENCGYYGIERNSLAVRPGQRVLLDRWTLWWRPPRRWEVAVARIDGRLTVKRVVGLPGETLEIKHGDIFADGQRVQKSAAQMQGMGVLVHDQRFRPTQQPQADHAPGWHSSPHSAWQPTRDGFRLPAVPADTSRSGSVTTADSATLWTDESIANMAQPAGAAWLYFQNRSTLPPPAATGHAVPIRDSYAVNQHVSRTLHSVPDVWCTADVQLAGNAALVLRVTNGHGEWVVCWEPTARTARLWESESRGFVATARTPVSGGRLPVVFGTCDGHIVFAVDGRTCLRFRDDRAASGADASRPLAIAAVSRAGLTISNLQVWRNVYYLPDPHQASWPVQLDAQQYLLLGDNSPLSIDARQGSRFGVVERAAFESLVIADSPNSVPPPELTF